MLTQIRAPGVVHETLVPEQADPAPGNVLAEAVVAEEMGGATEEVAAIGEVTSGVAGVGITSIVEVALVNAADAASVLLEDVAVEDWPDRTVDVAGAIEPAEAVVLADSPAEELAAIFNSTGA